MGLIDRVREVWDDLRGTRKEEQETASVSSEPARLKRVENILDHGSTANAQTVDPYFVARQEVQPALQAVADEHYRGRLDIVQRTHEIEVSSQVAHRTGLPLEVVRHAVSDVLLDAYVEHKEGVSERLNAAVGEDHSSEFRFRGKQGEVWTFEHPQTEQMVHLDSRGNFYDLETGQAPGLVSRQEIVDRFQRTPEVAIQQETADHRQQWEPLERAVGYHGADKFEHYSQRGDVSIYRQVVEEQDRFIGQDSKGRFYDVDQREYTPLERISREAALERVSDPVHFYTPPEPTPTHTDWSRLEQAVGRENAIDFTFKGKTAGIQSYQNDHTGNQVRLDSAGQFHNAEQQPIAREAALANVLPPHAIGSNQAFSATPEPVKAEGPSREQVINI